MGATLTVTPVKKAAAAATRYTGLPKIPQNTSVALDGDTYPGSRITRRASVVTSATDPTWIAQPNGTGTGAACLTSVTATAVSGHAVDTSAVSWASVTRTYQRPRNPNGGLPRFAVVVGTARLNSPYALQVTQSITETRQPLLSGANTWVTATKLPPICTTETLTSTIDLRVYSVQSTLILVPPSLTAGNVRANQWLGGDLEVRFTHSGPNQLVNIKVVPITPGTLTDNITAAVTLGTINLVAGANVVVYTAANLVTAGVIRWNYFWVFADYVVGPGSDSPGWFFRAPLDLPPPYDFPGVDGFIPGGYLT